MLRALLLLCVLPLGSSRPLVALGLREDPGDALFRCTAKASPRLRLRKQLRTLSSTLVLGCDYGAHAACAPTRAAACVPPAHLHATC